MTRSWCAAVLLCAVVVIAATVSPAAAEFKLTPSLQVREEYNDNISLASSNEQDDFITTITPALTLNLNASILTLSLDYGLNFAFYAKHSENNQTSLTQTQRAKLDTTLTLLKDQLFLHVSDTYQRVPIDQRNQVSLDNIFVNLTDSNVLQVNPYLELPLTSSLKARVGYTYLNTWYKDSRADNSEEHMATGGLTQQFGERLTVYGNYSYRWHRPDLSYAYDSQEPSIGATMRVTPKLTLSGSGGYTYIKYKPVNKQFLVFRNIGINLFQVSIVQVNTAPEDVSSVVWNAQANYQLTERLLLGAGYGRTFSDSVTEGTVKNDTATATIGYTGAIPIAISGFVTKGKYTITNREDRSVGGTISTSLPISSSITARINGTYTHYKFTPDPEQVDRYGVQVMMDYALKLVTIGMGYTFNLNDSSFNQKDYTNNIFFVSAKISL